MIEAPDASRMLSGDRANTNRPANRRAGRGHTPDKSASGRFVCHVPSPVLSLPGGTAPGIGEHTDNSQPSASQRINLLLASIQGSDWGEIGAGCECGRSRRWCYA